jgi:hypothetical protein
VRGLMRVPQPWVIGAGKRQKAFKSVLALKGS